MFPTLFKSFGHATGFCFRLLEIHSLSSHLLRRCISHHEKSAAGFLFLWMWEGLRACSDWLFLKAEVECSWHLQYSSWAFGAANFAMTLISTPLNELPHWSVAFGNASFSAQIS
ncbi:hypothetical protein TIFTF001_012151 [Ficus carica]|uniref:Uncharacterized protein n=1 Tax=Ficus carica TaxID=3494 RepID=A0AA88D3G1_FICCA|nr:hypothetical protein TIFTF001_012151 [Ficus carica]